MSNPDMRFEFFKKAFQQSAKPKPLPVRKAKRPKEKKMKMELKLYRITIAPLGLQDTLPSNELDSGCELLVLGTNGEEVCAKILDELPDSPHVAYPRIKITEIEGPFDHGTILSWTSF